MSQSQILIVEDENVVALDIKIQLTRLGYQIVGIVATGEDAIEHALALHPDLILMDINLRGEIDGVEAAHQIQIHENIPVVFLTAYADDTTFQRAVITKPFGYVIKPFDEKELKMNIEVALYRHEMESKLRKIAAENEHLHKEAKMHAAELEKRVSMRTAQLAQAHDRLQLILDSIDEAIYFINTDNALLYMNPAAERMTGYELSQAVGKTTALWRGTTAATVIEQFDQAQAKGQMWQGDVVNRRQDGVLYDAELKIIPVFDEDRNVESFVATQRDISDQKELQRLKKQFVYRIGHELRTPLTNIHLYLDLMERGDVTNQDRYIHILRHESKRLSKLIIGFLEISELDTTVDPPTTEPVDVNSMIVAAVNQNENVALLDELSVNYQIDSDLPLAMANKRLLERAFFHLVDNAAIYAPSNSHITIKTAVQLQQNREWITITVTNTGTGISSEEQGLLFDRFYRGEAAKQTGVPGAGLGLAFCKQSLEQQGGLITVNNNPETGVAFTIWLKKATNE